MSDSCPICFEPILDDMQEAKPRGCEHAFHWQCLLRHMETSPRRGCPVCRNGQVSDNGSEYSDDAEAVWVVDEEPPTPFHEVFKDMRRRGRTNKVVRGMCDTLTKHRSNRKTICKYLGKKRKELNMLERQMGIKIDAICDRKWKQFDATNQALILEVEEKQKEKNKTTSRIVSSIRRLREKHQAFQRREASSSSSAPSTSAPTRES